RSRRPGSCRRLAEPVRRVLFQFRFGLGAADDDRHAGAVHLLLAEAHIGDAALDAAELESVEEARRDRARNGRRNTIAVRETGPLRDLPRAVPFLEPVEETALIGEIEEHAVDIVAGPHLDIGLEQGAMAVKHQTVVAEPMLAAGFGLIVAEHPARILDEALGIAVVPGDRHRRVRMEEASDRIPIALVARESPQPSDTPDLAFIDEALRRIRHDSTSLRAVHLGTSGDRRIAIFQTPFRP